MALGPDGDDRAVDRMRAILGQDGTRDELDAALVDAIHIGRIAPNAPALVAHMKASALDALAIEQPKYAHELGQARGAGIDARYPRRR